MVVRWAMILFFTAIGYAAAAGMPPATGRASLLLAVQQVADEGVVRRDLPPGVLPESWPRRSWSNPELAMRLGVAAARLGDERKAMAMVGLLKGSPHREAVEAEVALLRIETGDFTGGYDIAQELQGDQRVAVLARLSEAVAGQDLLGAAQPLAEAYQVARALPVPDEVRALMRVRRTAIFLGLKDAAEQARTEAWHDCEHYGSVIARVSAFAAMGEAYADNGEGERAAAAFSAAREAATRPGTASENTTVARQEETVQALGLLAAAQNRARCYADAADTARAALEADATVPREFTDPTDDELRYQLAVAQLGAGRVDDALATDRGVRWDDMHEAVVLRAVRQLAMEGDFSAAKRAASLARSVLKQAEGLVVVATYQALNGDRQAALTTANGIVIRPEFAGRELPIPAFNWRNPATWYDPFAQELLGAFPFGKTSDLTAHDAVISDLAAAAVRLALAVGEQPDAAYAPALAARLLDARPLFEVSRAYAEAAGPEAALGWYRTMREEVASTSDDAWIVAGIADSVVGTSPQYGGGCSIAASGHWSLRRWTAGRRDDVSYDASGRIISQDGHDPGLRQ